MVGLLAVGVDVAQQRDHDVAVQSREAGVGYGVVADGEQEGEGGADEGVFEDGDELGVGLVRLSGGLAGGLEGKGEREELATEAWAGASEGDWGRAEAELAECRAHSDGADWVPAPERAIGEVETQLGCDEAAERLRRRCDVRFWNVFRLLPVYSRFTPGHAIIGWEFKL